MRRVAASRWMLPTKPTAAERAKGASIGSSQARRKHEVAVDQGEDFAARGGRPAVVRRRVARSSPD